MYKKHHEITAHLESIYFGREGLCSTEPSHQDIKIAMNDLAEEYDDTAIKAICVYDSQGQRIKRKHLCGVSTLATAGTAVMITCTAILLNSFLLKNS